MSEYRTVETRIPARLDRLPFSRWHVLVIFGQLIGTGDTTSLLIGYLIAAAVMIIAAITELVLGVRAEQRSLESVASPLTAIEQETKA